MPDDFTYGYSGLTPDQTAMLQQQGWFPQPTMSLPAGQTLQQPQGYSNLTPAQVATQQALGYYTQQPQQPQSLWDQITAKLGSPDLQKGLTQLGQATGPGQPRQNLAPPAPYPYSPGLNYGIYKNPYVAHKPSLDPVTALKVLMGEY